VKKSVLFAAAILASSTVCNAADHPKYAEPNKAKVSGILPDYVKSKTPLTGELHSVGADTMEDLMTLWIQDFQTMYPDVHITMEAKASGTAAPALTAGTADIGPVAREILPNEEAPFKAKFGYDLTGFSVAGGSYRTPGKTHAIAILVNEKNPVSKLTLAQLDAIYSTTRKRGYKEVKTWGDVGATGEFADKPIHLWGLIQPNGIAYYLQERVLEGGEYKSGIAERTTVGSLPALEAVARGVTDDPYAIGYSSFFDQANVKGTKALTLADTEAGPYYSGTFGQVVEQKYPLSRVIYIFVNRKPGTPLDPKVREFLKFVLSKQGQEDVSKEGSFLPLPASFVREQREKLQ
jgi:phosphate transport system substrate-binding protein